LYASNIFLRALPALPMLAIVSEITARTGTPDALLSTREGAIFFHSQLELERGWHL